MAVVDLQSSKIAVGSFDYPTLHNNMIDTIEAAINAAENWDNAALLAQAVIDTAADVVLTNADVVSTNADVVSTGDDVVLTNADVTYAEEWANKAEDSLVSVAAGGNNADEYSAKHHAAKADAATNYAGAAAAMYMYENF